MMHYYFDDTEESIINGQKDKLHIEQFELNDEKRKNTQILFHSVLDSVIRKYNSLKKQEREEAGIYYMKNKDILLVTINEEYIYQFLEYEKLFRNLMSKDKPLFFPKFDPKKASQYSISNKDDNRSNVSKGSQRSHNTHDNFQNRAKIDKYEKKGKYYKNKPLKDKEIIYYLKQFSSYFNGMFFESLALETFLNLIYKNCGKEKDVISFLPRMIFYMKKPGEEDNDYHGYNEIDCAFILKEKDEIKIDRGMITCYNSFESIKESEFFHLDNFLENLTIKKNDVVIIEVKSNWVNLNNIIEENKEKEEKDKGNELVKFIKKANAFVQHYEDLNLIKKSQKKY